MTRRSSRKKRSKQKQEQLQKQQDAQPQGIVENDVKRIAEETAVTVIQHHSGPLPPPEVLIQYNDADPNAANRVITMAEEQQAHRFKMETLALKTQGRQGYIGQVFGFIIGLAVIGTGAFLMHSGKEGYGISSVFMGLAALLTAYYRGTSIQKKELEKKKPKANQEGQ